MTTETVTRRSNAEKRAAVIALLTDPATAGHSAAAIARTANVSRNFVNGIRNKPPFCGNAEDYRPFRHKTGKMCVMRVDTIGERHRHKPVPSSEDREEAMLAGVHGNTVHLVKAGELTKIGFSRYGARYSLRTIKIANPAAVLAATISNADMAVKRRLHQMFASKHVVGDWFRLDAEDFGAIEEAL
jgi:hypothetical protein